MLSGSATIFTVRDLAASVAHYRDVLGFAVTFQYGEPTYYYACLCRDAVSLHLRGAGKNARWTVGTGAIAVFVDDVDALHADLAARGANVLKPPQDYAYGMRDFDVADPDGNQLTFGMESRPAS
jgi:catechol 2,3-dioxygenase-like lactoylglutathione lyase family enzyme